jgi:hypothetical protein
LPLDKSIKLEGARLWAPGAWQFFEDPSAGTAKKFEQRSEMSAQKMSPVYFPYPVWHPEFRWIKAGPSQLFER